MTTTHDLQSASTEPDIDDIRQVTNVVQDLITMMRKGNISTLDLSYGSLRLSLQSHAAGVPTVTNAPPQPAQQIPAPVAADDMPEEADGHIVTAPMIGTFYVAPAPNEPPFVTLGDEVAEGQTIGIIEAMKIMNEIAADRAGTVVEVLAGDGQTVEYGSPLVRIEPAGE